MTLSGRCRPAPHPDTAAPRPAELANPAARSALAQRAAR